MERIYVFKRFERFWHWSQAALIIVMMFTGFAVHGSHRLIGFEHAVEIHTLAAWALITLWVFAIFWHFTTGEWKQYIPTLDKLDAMVKYYLTGIFTDAPHPFRQTTLKKHNPLQRLAYLGVKLFINPLLWVTGLREHFLHTSRKRSPRAVAAYLAAQALIEDIALRHGAHGRPVKLAFI